MAPRQFNYIDLFAGCGGLSLGLYNSGWEGLFAIEKNPMAFTTLKFNLIEKKHHFNWPDWLDQGPHDINNVIRDFHDKLEGLEGKVDLVAGGPPCQGFSFAGKRREYDLRNQLAKSYAKFVEIVKPQVIFFENVRGFTSKFVKRSSEGQIYSEFVTTYLESLGYEVKYRIIDFSKYGVPQARKRFILIGMLDGDPESFFTRLDSDRISFLKGKGISQTTTVREAISDLERCHGEIDSPDTNGFKAGIYGMPQSQFQEMMRKKSYLRFPDSHRFANHRNPTIERFKYYLDTCQKNKNIARELKEKLNLRKKCIIPIHPDLPCPTLTTLPDDYIHYCEPRILTVREFARLQSFNDWFEFKEKYTTGGKLRTVEVPRYTQVGNAVPPLFVEQAGNVIKSLI